MAQINASLLNTFNVTLSNQPVFGTQQLTQFIGHTPMFMSYNQARMDFQSCAVSVKCSSIECHGGYLRLDISCIRGDLQVSYTAQICSQLSFLVSRTERLYIQETPWLLTTSQVNSENAQWLELFYSFTAVQALYLCHSFWSPIMSALQGLSEESVTGILPGLVDLYLEGYWETAPEFQDIDPFITAHQCTSHPVAVHRWTR